MICAACGQRAAVHQHHILARQKIMREVRPIAGRRAKAVQDKRNLMPLCFDCHMGHENWAPRLYRDQVPAEAWEFARELGEWATVALERAYPERVA